MLFVCAGPISFGDGGDGRKGRPKGRFHSDPTAVWGGKVGGPPREAVVAGTLG